MDNSLQVPIAPGHYNSYCIRVNSKIIIIRSIPIVQPSASEYFCVTSVKKEALAILCAITSSVIELPTVVANIV